MTKVREVGALADKYRGQKLSPIFVQQLLRENYIDSFRILKNGELDDPKKPMASIAVNKTESHIGRDSFSKRIEQFRVYRLAETYNISLLEFLDLPIPLVDEIIDQHLKQIHEQNKLLNDAQRNAQQQEKEELIRNGQSGNRSVFNTNFGK